MTNQPNQTSPPSQDAAVLPEPRAGRGFWLLMLGSMVFVGGVAYLQYTRVDRARNRGKPIPVRRGEALPVLGALPEFALTERSGRRVGLDDLTGRIWVADFFFTYCAGPCPVMSRRMAELQSLIEKNQFNDVLCVSFTVDPEHDTPAVLSEYAEVFSAKPDRWLFLTGDKRHLRDLAIKGFKIAVQDPEQGDDQIIHSTRFVLVDRVGRIRGYYTLMTPEEEEDPRRAADVAMPPTVRETLLSDIRRLRREGRR